MLQKNTVTIVVVTYNRKELLKECINNILNQSFKDFSLIVIDNSSTDGTYDHIKDLVKDNVYYINTGSNLGGAGGFNYGIKKALEFNSKYIWIMDDDCMVHNDSCEQLVSFANNINDDFGFLSSVVRWSDDSICKMNIQKISLTKKVENFTIDQKIKFSTFVSFFVKSKTVLEVGLPIKDFFIWGDDLEYSSRISDKYNSYLVSKSVVTHKSKTNIGSNIVLDDSKNINRYKYAYRNEQYLYRKMGLKAKLFYFLKKKLHIFKIKRSDKEDKQERINIIKESAKEGKIFNPKIEYYYPKDQEIKVLEFFGEPLAYGGQEMFMLNMLDNFSDKNINYTLLSPFELTNKSIINYKNNGLNVINYDYKFESKFRKLYIKKALKKTLKNNKYDIIHIQSGSIYTLFKSAKIAKKYGINKIIVHSHSTGNNNFKYRLIKRKSDKIIDKYANIYLGCSILAAKWKFPKNVIDNNNYLVINNGVDIKKYTYSDTVKEKIRKEYNIDNSDIVLCHVGRFALQKNQDYLLNIYPNLIDKIPNIKFIMVGAGSDKQSFIDKTKKLNIYDKFIFLENISNVNEIMISSDIFVFPSIFEGFPITLIEAQTTGLRFIKSDNITDEALVTDLGCSLSLDDANLWISKIIEYSNNLATNREKYSNIMKEKGYDSKDSAKLLEDVYRGNI